MSRQQKGITLDGHHFDSKAEGRRYTELKLMQRAGEISQLTLQPSFQLQVRFKLRKRVIRPITYTADFAYTKNGKRYIEDCKGHATESYRIKKKLFLNLYGEQYIFIESKAKAKTFAEIIY